MLFIVHVVFIRFDLSERMNANRKEKKSKTISIQIKINILVLFPFLWAHKIDYGPFLFAIYLLLQPCINIFMYNTYIKKALWTFFSTPLVRNYYYLRNNRQNHSYFLSYVHCWYIKIHSNSINYTIIIYFQWKLVLSLENPHYYPPHPISFLSPFNFNLIYTTISMWILFILSMPKAFRNTVGILNR